MVLRVLCSQCHLQRFVKPKVLYFTYVTSVKQQNLYYRRSTAQMQILRRSSNNFSTLSTRPVCGNSLFTNKELQQRHRYTDDVESNSNIEKRLIILMDEWEVEKAVKLLKKGIAVGDIPDRTLVLNLIQLIANLGEYALLVDLHDILAVNVISSKNFYKCLNEAYYKCGRVSEGVAHLRILYHKTRKYKNVDIFFVLISVMILRHFPQSVYLIYDFVEECEEMGDSLPGAGLWKTYMLMSKFEDADKILSENEKIKLHLTQMTMDIIESKHDMEIDKKAVLYRLSELDLLEDRARASVYFHLVYFLCISQCLTELQPVLNLAKKYMSSNDVLPNDQEKIISEILDSLQEKEMEASTSERQIITDCIDELRNMQTLPKKQNEEC